MTVEAIDPTSENIQGSPSGSPVKDLVRLKFPGIELESDVQGWAFLEEFEKGIECYRGLKSPTAKDERWLGVCHFQLIQDMQALEAFYRAISRGEAGARINLAHLLRFLERSEESARELSSVDPELVTPYDQVLYFRVLSTYEETNGNVRTALRHAEEAWRKVQGLPEFPILAPSILSQLGVLYGRIGHAQRALWYLNRGLYVTDGAESKKVHLKRAAVLIILGRLEESLAQLKSLAFPTGSGLREEKEYLLGEISWANGNISLCREHHERAIRLSIENQTSYEEFVCRIALAAFDTFFGSVDDASEHLARAQSLISDRSDRLAYRFREISLLYRQGSYRAEHAIAEFEALATEFGEMGLLQEQAWVRVHLLDLYLERGMDPARLVTALKSLAATLQNRFFLAKELALLPRAREALATLAPELVPAARHRLQLVTLGEEAMFLDDERVRVPLKRAPEIIAYFLEHKTVSLRRLLTDVFADDKPRSAKSYFHQVRHQLRQEVEGLEIEYDRESRLYNLRSSIDILWDVAEVRAGNRAIGTEIFLPSSGSEWAQRLDGTLDAYRS